MTYKRRDFLKTVSVLGTGVALSPVINMAGCKAAGASGKINDNFGLQLYTLRDVLPNDPKGVLTQVASFGYKQIESYEGAQGMFWGMTNTEFKKFMDDLGMKIVSSHVDINKDFDRKVAEAAAIGMNYLICPWLGPQKTLDDYKKAADTFNNRGEICKKNGLRFAYHNHDYSFLALDGQMPQDVMMQNTGKDLVDYEMDIYWVVAAGQDPIAWFNKYPDRFRLGHVKDRKKNAPLSDKNASTVLGTGSINFPEILKAAESKGMDYFIVEQELYENTTPIEAAKADAAYMKTIRI